MKSVKVNRLFSFIMEKNILNYKTSAWAILAFGILIRIYFYFFIPASFTFDEANVYLLITRCGYMDILVPGRGCALACKHYPFLFLAMSKFLVSVLGSHRFVLRFIPLLSSIGALVLFNKLKNVFLSPKAGLLALFLFATNWWAIYYGMNFKAYACDLLATVSLMVIFSDMHMNKDITVNKGLLYAGLGSVFVWLSNPSIFILITGVLVLGAIEIVQKHINNFNKAFLLIFMAWILSFLINYFVRIRSQTLDAALVLTWQSMLFSYTDGFWAVLLRAWKLFFTMFANPLVMMPFWGLSLYMLGCIYLFKRDRFVFFMLSLPVVLTMVGAVINKYVFADRLLVFLIPIVCMGIAQGVWFLYVLIKDRYMRLVVFIVCCFLILPTTKNFITQITRDANSQGCPPKLEYVLERFKEGDIIYVGHGVRYLLEYCNQTYRILPCRFIFASGNPQYTEISDDLEKLKQYKRVWFFSNTVFKPYDKYLRHRLQEIGPKKDQWCGNEFSIHLYEVNESISNK